MVRLWWNVLVANLATNFQDLVAKVKNLGALVPVLGAISRPVMWYFLWIDLSNIQFRFDVMEEKEGTWMQTVLDV